MVESVHQSNKRVGIEISDKRLTAVAVDENDAITFVNTIGPPDSEDPIAGVVSLVESLRTEVKTFGTVGLAFPGMIDKKTSRIAYSTSFPGYSDIDLVREIKTATGISVNLENDANSAAYGEFAL